MTYITRRFGLAVAVLGLLGTAAGRAGAAPTLSLSSPDDLSHLVVGQQAEVDVTLSGLPAGSFIFNLDSQVLFPSSQFNLVSGPTATKAFGSVFFGPDVIADPQVANFQAHSGALAAGGGVLGNYPDETANGVGAIGQNGLYYSFLLQAKSPGSGSIGFDLSTPDANRYSGTDSGFAFAPLPTGPSLQFAISPAVATPEPATLTLLSLGLAGLAARYGWRRRKA